MIRKIKNSAKNIQLENFQFGYFAKTWLRSRGVMLSNTKDTKVNSHNGYKNLVDVFGGAANLNNTSYISMNPKFIYFTNPKVACSAIKATLNTAVSAFHGKEIQYESMEQVHSRDFNVLLMPKDIGKSAFMDLIDDDDVLKFTFYRDPVSRVLSAYLNKIGGYNEGPAKILYGSRACKKLYETLGWHSCKHISFVKFADLVSSEEHIRDLNRHWRLQRDQIGFDVVKYSCIGEFEKFNDHFEKIIEPIFPDFRVKILDLRQKFPGHATKSSDFLSCLPASTRRSLEKAYESDYDMISDIRTRGLLPK